MNTRAGYRSGMSYTFNPDLVAECEGRGWRAYYDRNWSQFITLMTERFVSLYHLPLEDAQHVAALSVQAAKDFVPLDHNMDKVRESLTTYYAIVKRYSGLPFDPAQAAELEAEYWDVHRRLVGKPDKTEFVNTMIALHSHVFGITPEQARESAEYRVEANNIVDGITQKTSLEPERDWLLLEEKLKQCYRSIQKQLGTMANNI